MISRSSGEVDDCGLWERLTLLDAVLLSTLVVLILLLAGDTLDTLVKVVLVGGALGRSGRTLNEKKG